jgi:lipopolysaccharide export system protein LptA
VVRRYNGATLNDETTGAVIVYDNNTDVFTVDGGAQNNRANPGGRIRAMLSPRAAASAPGAPAAPAARPATLRPSTTLGTEKN